MLNAEKIYKKELQGLVKEIKDICVINKIPMFFTIAINDDGNNTKYETTTTVKSTADHYISEAVTPIANNIELTDDRITKMLAVMNGFDVVPQHKVEVLDMDELEI